MMHNIINLFLIVTVSFLFFSLILFYFYRDIYEKKKEILLKVVFSISILLVALRWFYAGHPPLLGTFEQSLSATFALLLFARYFDRTFKYTSYAFHYVFVIYIYGLFFSKMVRPEISTEVTFWTYFHVTFAWTAFGFLTFSFFAALSILFQDNKSEYFEDPSTQKLLITGLVFGFSAFTIMFFFGSYFASRVLGSWWKFDPAHLLFLSAWLIYTIPLHGALFFNWKNKVISWWIFLAYIVTFVLYWGLIYFNDITFHIFDIEFKTHSSGIF